VEFDFTGVVEGEELRRRAQAAAHPGKPNSINVFGVIGCGFAFFFLFARSFGRFIYILDMLLFSLLLFECVVMRSFSLARSPNFVTSGRVKGIAIGGKSKLADIHSLNDLHALTSQAKRSMQHQQQSAADMHHGGAMHHQTVISASVVVPLKDGRRCVCNGVSVSFLFRFVSFRVSFIYLFLLFVVVYVLALLV
jgi:hypothetical protein